MANSLNPQQAREAYCRLLKLIRETGENASAFPGASWEPVFSRLNDALVKAKEVLLAHGIDPSTIRCP